MRPTDKRYYRLVVLLSYSVLRPEYDKGAQMESGVWASSPSPPLPNPVIDGFKDVGKVVAALVEPISAFCDHDQLLKATTEEVGTKLDQMLVASWASGLVKQASNDWKGRVICI